MKKVNEKDVVKSQYENTEKLDIRIMIHKKYSTNQVGFSNWIYSNYDFKNQMNILELGCGTGDMWKNNLECLNDSKLILTDFSEAMVNKAKENLGENNNVVYNTVNIQDIPYSDKEFDRVIANMMLYHVPDLSKALSEVNRVMKNDGIFYCATYGQNTILSRVAELLDIETKDEDWVFTLQNGYDILKPFFKEVIRLDYEDSLNITDIDDLIEYIESLKGMHGIELMNREDIKEKLKSKMINGVIKIPKEYGMFICKK